MTASRIPVTGGRARRASTPLVVAAALLGAVAAPAAAQGTVATQGFGYPVGQLSTRARSTGGAAAPFDPESPINPAALALTPGVILHAQYEPEFRSVDPGEGGTVRSRVSRFPLFAAAFTAGRRTAIGLSASTLLDRTFQINTTGERTVEGQTVETQESRSSTGGITDVRLGFARSLSPRFAVGLAAHGVTGENRVNIGFSDTSSQALTFSDSVRLNYSGFAVSAGATWRAARHLALGAHARRGVTLRLEEEIANRRLGSVHGPDQYGGGILYDGIAGTALTANVGWQGWTSMNELSPTALARDVWNAGLGADAAGPRFGSGTTSLRAGVSYRQLPFALPDGREADELAFAFGAGVPLAFNRANLDLAVQRAARSAGDARETGWTLSVGVTVRP